MSPGSKLSAFWQSYKYRFVPWLALNFSNRTARRVDGGRADKVVPDEEALQQVTTLTRALVGSLSRPLGLPDQQQLFPGSVLNTDLNWMTYEDLPGGGAKKWQDSQAGRYILMREKMYEVQEAPEPFTNKFMTEEARDEQTSQSSLKDDVTTRTINSPGIGDFQTGTRANIEISTKVAPELDWLGPSKSTTVDPPSAHLSREEFTTVRELGTNQNLKPLNAFFYEPMHVADPNFPRDFDREEEDAKLKVKAEPLPSPLSKDVDPYDLCLVPPKSTEVIHEKAQQVLEETCGFRVECCTSAVGGTGVCVTNVIGRDALPPGTVVGIYPGTLYLPQQQSVILQSLGNPFMFRCFDGLLVDGNNRGLSKILFRSCAGRDRVGPCPTADVSWLTEDPMNPLSVGQFVNNRTSSNPANVAYQEITVQPGTFTLPELAYLPMLWYSPPPHTPLLDIPFRLVVLVTTREVAPGDELFSEYFTIIT